jgi:C1A family cysteine protease
MEIKEIRVRDNKWYGCIPDYPDIRDLKFSAPKPMLEALPSSVDLRSKLASVYDQGNLGSCTANAGCGIFHYNQIQQDIKWESDPSRLYLYYNTRRLEGTVKQDSGASIRDTIKAIASYGMCLENDWPYMINKFTTKPPQKNYKFGRQHTAVIYERVEQNLNQIKAVLASGELVVIGFSVYSGFETPEVATSGQLNMPGAGEYLMGGHAVLFVGYDDATQRLWVRNSWGADWGINGDFTMPYEYAVHPDLACDFWTVRTVK